MCFFIIHSSESSASLVWGKLYSLVLCFTLVQSTVGALWRLGKQLAERKDLDTSHDPEGLSHSDPLNICTSTSFSHVVFL